MDTIDTIVWLLIGAIVISFVMMVVGLLGLFAMDLGLTEGSIRGKVIDQEYAGLWSKHPIFHVQTTFNETHQFTLCESNPNKDAIVGLIKDAQLNGKEVIVHYKDLFWYWHSECDTRSTPAVDVVYAK